MSVNLLDDRTYRIVGQRFTATELRRAALFTVPALISGLVVIGLLLWQYDAARKDFDRAEIQVREANTQQRKIALDVDALRLRQSHISALISSYTQTRATLVDSFRPLVAFHNALPGGVNITQADYKGAAITLSGEAKSFDQLVAAQRAMGKLGVSFVINAVDNSKGSLTWSGLLATGAVAPSGATPAPQLTSSPAAITPAPAASAAVSAPATAATPELNAPTPPGAAGNRP